MFARPSLWKAAPKDRDPTLRRGLSGREKGPIQARKNTATKGVGSWKHRAATSHQFNPELWTPSCTRGLNSQWYPEHVPGLQRFIKMYIFSSLVWIISLIMSNCIIIVNTANLILYSGCAITMCNEDDANSSEKILHQDFGFEKFSISNTPTEGKVHVCSTFLPMAAKISSWHYLNHQKKKKNLFKVQEFICICPVFQVPSMI